RRSKSMAILSRRKKGKTALLQRFFNILFTRGGPQLIPFYYRIPEDVQTKSDFTATFYRRVLTQYFAFITRKPEWLATIHTMDQLRELAASDPLIVDDIHKMEDLLTRTPTSAWPFAQEVAHRISQWQDVRIVQILDEFQYMNKYVVADDDPSRVELFCHSYMGAAESKFSPQIVAGSYIGWLTEILRHLTARHRRWHLGSFTDAEALEAVYTYAAAWQVPITDETAPHIAEVCFNDPFYIAATISNLPAEKDLTTEDGVRDALTFETAMDDGEIAHTWGEYLADAIERVNDQNAQRIVLYLANHEPEERTRTEIRQDLALDMTEKQLGERLYKLVRADILAQGSSNYHYRGLGDRVFAMVFRRIYGAEIERVGVAEIDDDFKRELTALKGRLSVHRGAAAEYLVCYRLQRASLAGATVADVVQDCEDATPIGPFARIRKARFYVDQETSVEVDLHAVHQDDDGTDLMVEVKDWQKAPPKSAVGRFIEVKSALEGQPPRRTLFLFYSQSGVAAEAAARLGEAGILLLDADKLAGFEAGA
ncbi:MAG: hypothetical protein GY738_10865, partial [Pseudoalteromonas sp.]|nr:hypothetical protein [Pseudoalteromonas sp.]